MGSCRSEAITTDARSMAMFALASLGRFPKPTLGASPNSNTFSALFGLAFVVGEQLTDGPIPHEVELEFNPQSLSPTPANLLCRLCP